MANAPYRGNPGNPGDRNNPVGTTRAGEAQRQTGEAAGRTGTVARVTGQAAGRTGVRGQRNQNDYTGPGDTRWEPDPNRPGYLRRKHDLSDVSRAARENRMRPSTDPTMEPDPNVPGTYRVRHVPSADVRWPLDPTLSPDPSRPGLPYKGPANPMDPSWEPDPENKGYLRKRRT